MRRDPALGCLQLVISESGGQEREFLISPYETHAIKEAQAQQAQDGGGTGEDGGKTEKFRFEW